MQPTDSMPQSVKTATFDLLETEHLLPVESADASSRKKAGHARCYERAALTKPEYILHVE